MPEFDDYGETFESFKGFMKSYVEQKKVDKDVAYILIGLAAKVDKLMKKWGKNNENYNQNI
jgi:hypothetical protein